MLARSRRVSRPRRPFSRNGGDLKKKVTACVVALSLACQTAAVPLAVAQPASDDADSKRDAEIRGEEKTGDVSPLDQTTGKPRRRFVSGEGGALVSRGECCDVRWRCGGWGRVGERWRR